ncbi:myxochelin export MFS transporter MxcK [Pyxidicoccus parkwayensis]|uniref:Myxochelin export MFS transporter MxcK n=1 Tax=Pyxidicoccus parkwayensis TaxID=2813578 RepID=A0ABX7P7I5_9BACT|nr:myxochelin export MFS transporter MxcK [Pyxidicoccus parkwaysis]QSQ26370.1 myxochelin export MFS transporter MxcK [Pyxidicoccus parkwaysis]
MSASVPPRQERQLLWLLAAVQFTHLMDFMLVMPLGPELMRVFSMSTARFGTMVSAYTLASAAMGVSGLFWLDRFDRKRALLTLYGVFIVATLACGAAPGPTALLVARMLAGACAGLMGAVVMAIIGDLVPPERRGRAIGTVMSSLGLSAVAGVPLGLGIASQLGWRGPFFVIGALAAVVWLCLLWRMPPVRQHLTAPSAGARRNPLAPLAAPGLALGWLLTFSVVFSSFLLIPYLGAYMVGNLGLRLEDLSWVYLGGGVATLLTARLVGQFADRYGPARVLVALLVGTVVPHLVFTHLSPSVFPVVMAVFMVFMATTSSRAIPTIALVTSRVPPHLRGRYLAVNMAASDAASGLSAWASGLWIATAPHGALVGFGQVGWMAVGVTALALCILWTLGRTVHPVAPNDASFPVHAPQSSPH